MSISEILKKSLKSKFKIQILQSTSSGMLDECINGMVNAGFNLLRQSHALVFICGMYRYVIYLFTYYIYIAGLLFKSELEKDTKPLGIYIYADKDKLSSFGTQQGYPVLVRITNLNEDVRNGLSIGGGRIVALFPIVSLLLVF
jgi:hypothetical protein